MSARGVTLRLLLSLLALGLGAGSWIVVALLVRDTIS